MTIRQSAIVYAIVNFMLGCAGFLITHYLLFFKILNLLGRSGSSSNAAVLVVSMATIAVLLTAASLAFYVAFALSIGFVDKVSGTYRAATIHKNEEKVFLAKIRKVFFLGSDFTIGGKKVVFFITGITPRICQANSFHVDQPS